MIRLDYAARQIGASWNMAFNRDGWTKELDRSVDGVFRSFGATALAFPFVAIAFLSIRRAAPASAAAEPIIAAPLAVGLAAQLVGYLADWVVALVLLLAIASALKADRRAADIIVGYNWLQPPVAAIMSAPFATLALPQGKIIAEILFLPALAAAIVLNWGLIRRALGADISVSLGILFLLTLVSLFVQAFAARAVLAVLQLFY
jgi:hypothetical protein